MRFVPRLSLFLLAALVLGLPAVRPASAQETSADLQTVKLDSPDPVPPGGTITYDIIVTNGGPDAADNATLSDTLPTGTTFVSLVSEPGWSCMTPMVGSGGTVDCSISSFAVGSAGFTLTVMVDSGVTPGTVITNAATADSDAGDPDEGEDNTGSAETTVAAPPPTTDVSVTKVDSPDPVLPGSSLVYTITVSNSGPADATSVNLVDPLPPETTFLSLSAPGGWSCTTPAVGTNDAVLCSISSLGPGSAVFTLTVAVGSGVTPGTEIFNTAIVSSADDLDEVNNTGSATTTVASPASPATLSGTKTVAGTFMPGGAVTYTVVLTNSGPSAQGDNPGNEFTDVLPATLTLVSAASTSGTAAAIVATNTVTWNGPLASGASVTLTINAVINAGVAPGTTVSNQGTIAYDADGNGTNEASAVTDDPATEAADDPTSFQVAALPSIVAIPTLGALGLALLAALLACGGARLLRRQRSA